MCSQIIELRLNGLSYSDISKKLNLSKSTISYHLKRYGMAGPINNRGIKISQNTINQINDLISQNVKKLEISKKLNISYATVKKYSEKKALLTEEEKKINEYKKHARWRVNIKLKCVEFLGGKCSICGYNKCLAALDLHHLDGNNKEFTISGGNLKSFEKLKPELDKCVVLCSNCHRELHNPHLNGLL